MTIILVKHRVCAAACLIELNCKEITLVLNNFNLFNLINIIYKTQTFMIFLLNKQNQKYLEKMKRNQKYNLFLQNDISRHIMTLCMSDTDISIARKYLVMM